MSTLIQNWLIICITYKAICHFLSNFVTIFGFYSWGLDRWELFQGNSYAVVIKDFLKFCDFAISYFVV